MKKNDRFHSEESTKQKAKLSYSEIKQPQTHAKMKPKTPQKNIKLNNNTNQTVSKSLYI